ncbi:hypothetical protein [Aeromicrobium sp. NPDC092404]|uniref:hypothetical protein n=1 Tax=Aeromicrobium sp. NPDC092404 TaxID=3154976 RepID=UPI00343CDBDC
MLIVLVMIAASVFLAQPATADEPVAPAADTSSSETTENVEEEPPPPPPAPEPEPPAPEPEPPAPVVEEPVVEEPVVEEPVVEEPVVEEPVVEEPVVEEPVVAEVVAEDEDVVAAAPVKITICHSTSSETNPYVQNAPNASGDLHGHTGHTGGLFPTPGWGDIIPPFEFDGEQYPGLNWTAEGQAIYNNGCDLPDEPPVELINATPVPPTATPPTCTADGTLVIPDTEGVIYESTPAGTGPGDYVVTASAVVGYVLTDLAFEEEITVLPMLSADDPECAETPPSGEEPRELEDPSAVKEDELLPDTGGLPLWMLLVAGPMTAAGLVILMRRRPVAHAAIGGGMPSYSLILPPVSQPVVTTRVHASAQPISFMEAVGDVVAAIGSFFRGGRH